MYTAAKFLIFDLFLCTHYPGWMSFLMLFLGTLPSCEQHKQADTLTIEMYASIGNRNRDLSFLPGSSNHSSTLTINELMLKLLHFFGISINTCWLWFGLFIHSSFNSNRKHLHLYKKCRFCQTVSFNTHLTKSFFIHALPHILIDNQK